MPEEGCRERQSINWALFPGHNPSSPQVPKEKHRDDLLFSTSQSRNLRAAEHPRDQVPRPDVTLQQRTGKKKKKKDKWHTLAGEHHSPALNDTNRVQTVKRGEKESTTPSQWSGSTMQ